MIPKYVKVEMQGLDVCLKPPETRASGISPLLTALLSFLGHLRVDFLILDHFAGGGKEHFAWYGEIGESTNTGETLHIGNGGLSRVKRKALLTFGNSLASKMAF